MKKNILEQKVKKFLDELRIYITQDGGDMEFVTIKNRLVYIRLKGNCVGCSLVEMTFKEGIEELLLKEFPYDIDGIELII